MLIVSRSGRPPGFAPGALQQRFGWREVDGSFPYCSCFAQTRRQIPARNRAILQIREGRKDLDFEGDLIDSGSG